MIHNFQHQFNPSGELSIRFKVVTEVGSVEVKVDLAEKDREGRPKAYAEEYTVLGVKYTNELNVSPTMKQGIKKLGNSLIDICENNGWNLWSY